MLQWDHCRYNQTYIPIWVCIMGSVTNWKQQCARESRGIAAAIWSALLLVLLPSAAFDSEDSASERSAVAKPLIQAHDLYRRAWRLLRDCVGF